MGSSKSKDSESNYDSILSHIVLSDGDINKCKQFYEMIKIDYESDYAMYDVMWPIICDDDNGCDKTYADGPAYLKHFLYCRTICIHEYFKKHITKLSGQRYKCLVCKNRYMNRKQFETHINVCIKTVHGSETDTIDRMNTDAEYNWYATIETERLCKLGCVDSSIPDIVKNNWKQIQAIYSYDVMKGKIGMYSDEHWYIKKVSKSKINDNKEKYTEKKMDDLEGKDDLTENHEDIPLLADQTLRQRNR